MAKVEAKYRIVAFLIVAALIAGVILLFNSCTAKSSSEKAEDEQHSRDIAVMSYAQLLVEEHLVSPSSAKFASLDEHRIVGTGLRYKIEGYVDSENAMGASLRKDYVVILEFEDEKMEAYTPKYVQIGDEVMLDRTG